jgi:hypothetical protein
MTQCLTLPLTFMPPTAHRMRVADAERGQRYSCTPHGPLGSRKQSGIGSELGIAGPEEFVARQTFAAAGD